MAHDLGGYVKKGRRASSGQEKVAWLLANEKLWHGISPAWQNTADQRRVLRTLREEMTSVGLYSSRSYWRDIEHSIFKHIQLARKEEAKRT